MAEWWDQDMPSGSALDRAKACPGSFALPRTRFDDSADSTFGTNVHAFIVASREFGRDTALADLIADNDGERPAHYAFCERIPFDQLPQGGRCEVAFAYDVTTGKARELVVNGPREYADLSADEIPMTLDLVGQLDGVAIYVDWKTGYGTLKPPGESMQLRAGALAVARARGLSSARAAFFRLKDDGSFWAEWVEFDCFDLEDIASELTAIVAEVRAERAKYHEMKTADFLRLRVGDHCKYCESFGRCPEQAGLASQLVMYEGPGELTAQTASEAWKVIERYDAISERIRQSLREFAKLTPFSTGPGKELRAVDVGFTSKPNLTETVRIVAEVIDAAGGQGIGRDIASAMIEQSISLKAIDGAVARAASLLGPSVIKQSALSKRVYEQLEEKRAIVCGTRQQVRVSKARNQ